MRSHRKRTIGAVCVVVFFGLAAIPACGSDDADTVTEQGGEETFESATAVTTGEGGMIFANDSMGFVPQAEVTMDDGETVMLPIDEVALIEVFPDEAAVEGVNVTVEWVDGQQLITGRAD